MFQAEDMKKDPTWNPPTPTVPPNIPTSKYLIVKKDSLVKLLSRCNACPSGVNSLQFSESGHALTCKCTCTGCGAVFMWENSPVLPTSNASSKEKLREINVDMVVSSAVTAVGTSVSSRE